MTYKFAVYCLSILLIADFAAIIVMLMAPQKDRVHGGMGSGIMAMYSVGGLLILTIFGVLFLVAYFRKSYKSIELLAWLMIIGNSFVLFGFLSFLITSLLQLI
jgi:hypothetical protein